MMETVSATLKKFTEPVTKALSKLGVKAELSVVTTF